MQSFIFTANDDYPVINNYDHRQLQPGFPFTMDWPPDAPQQTPQPLPDTDQEQSDVSSLVQLDRFTQSYESDVPRTVTALDWCFQLPHASHFPVPPSLSCEQRQTSIYPQYQEQIQSQAMTLTRQTCSPPQLISSYRYSGLPFIRGDADAQSFSPWIAHQDNNPNLVQPREDNCTSLSGCCPQFQLLPVQPGSLDVGSPGSNDAQWRTYPVDCVDPRAYLTTSRYDPAVASISNPGLHLHLRTVSNSSMDDSSDRSNYSSGDELLFGTTSPESEPARDFPPHQTVQGSVSISQHGAGQFTPPDSSLTSPARSDGNEILPVIKKQSTIKLTTMVGTKIVSSGKKQQAKKRVGRRTGPLKPEQRRSAADIRKRKACLRCKYLKKTCDAGDPCSGCKPSHARLWQVPCTRSDIRDIGNFIDLWHGDCSVLPHMRPGIIQGYDVHERTMYITHGYNHELVIEVRKVFAKEEGRFNVSWIESDKVPVKEFDITTARLAPGAAGISESLVSAYIEAHLDGSFNEFVDKHFAGTEFLTEMLKTAYRYYCRTALPVMRNALKLVIAYNLTQQITILSSSDNDCETPGLVTDKNSKYYGRVVAPVMINYELKRVMSLMWRRLQREVLDELQSLYASVYSGARLKHWPTIFMLAMLLLGVWEEMQFDFYYRTSNDPVLVHDFCHSMEKTPVGVVVGLFSTISQKIPGFRNWDSKKHHTILNCDVDDAICEALSEVRDHVLRYGKSPCRRSLNLSTDILADGYLKSRADCHFDPQDFDCFANKFLSRLIIRTSTPVRE